MSKVFSIIPFAAIAVLSFTGCSKSTTTPATTTTPTPTATGKFTCTLAGDGFSAPDAYIMPASGGTIAVMAKDSKGRYFSIAIFEKDFPVNKEVNVAFSPSISYTDENSKAHIAKSGTMTITAYGKNSSGTVTNLKGNFSIVLTGDADDIIAKDGAFDVNTK